MTDVAVALLKTTEQTVNGLGGNHTAAFGIVVDQSVSFLNRLVAANAGLRMVVAPEYFYSSFAPTGSASYSTPMAISRSEKHDIYDDLKKISARVQDVVIIAGSIFYTKGLISKKGLNVCPVLQFGNFLYKYYKKFDDGNLGRQDDDAIWRDKNTGPVFTASGVLCGLEICGDHGDANGNGTGAAERNWPGGPNNLDLQVLISDGAAPLASAIHTKTGGYIVWTDLQSRTANIRSYDTTGVVPTQTMMASKIEGATQVNGVSIVCYQFTV